MIQTVYCPECEAACSEADPTCPLCGHQLQEIPRKRMRSRRVFPIVAAGIFATACLIAVGFRDVDGSPLALAKVCDRLERGGWTFEREYDSLIRIRSYSSRLGDVSLLFQIDIDDSGTVTGLQCSGGIQGCTLKTEKSLVYQVCRDTMGSMMIDGGPLKDAIDFASARTSEPVDAGLGRKEGHWGTATGWRVTFVDYLVCSPLRDENAIMMISANSIY